MRIAFFLSMMFLFTSCSTWKYRPLREYRVSEAYSFKNKESMDLRLDSIYINQFLVATGVLKNSRIVDSIEYDSSYLKLLVQNRLHKSYTGRVLADEPLQIRNVKEFAFYNDWGTKKKLGKSINLAGNRIYMVPYIEFSVRTAKEREGGGGISMVYGTGQRIHSMVVGVILNVVQGDNILISSAYYYSDMFKNSVDSVTIYEFPYEKIDSLLALCKSDLNDKIIE